jgi:hypothetical protein
MMNEQIFKELYEKRTKYPLGSSADNRNDETYINDEIKRQDSTSCKFLVLPAHYFERINSRKTKETIEKNNHLVGVFDIGQIFEPLTGVKFYLYAFSSAEPRMVWFGELLNNCKPFDKRARDLEHNHGMFPEYAEPEGHFIEYLSSIDLAVSDNKKDDYIANSYRMFGVDLTKVGDRTNVEYYRPEYIELEAKYAHEETVRLGDIAEIIHPSETNPENEMLYTIKLASANYPLRPDALIEARASARVSRVKKGDIVTNKFLNSAYLNLTNRQDLAIANTQIIIRLHDKRFDKAYLTTYLNSERMKVYFERRKHGVTIPMISKQDLADFDIVVPTAKTNLAAKSALSSLGEFATVGERIKAIDQLLFQRNPLLDKPLQNELLAELYGQLRTTKNIQVRELFELDLHEIEKCYKAGAYKASLVLCGSLLEALVLDWLSEVEQHDYFKDTDITNLESLINKLRSAERLSQHEAHLAHDIRKKRNLIHPKNYIINSPLEKSVCESVMQSLKPLIRRRYANE